MTKISAILEKMVAEFFENHQFGIFFSIYHQTNPKFANVIGKTEGFLINTSGLI
jgi:hypothetical protein